MVGDDRSREAEDSSNGCLEEASNAPEESPILPRSCSDGNNDRDLDSKDAGQGDGLVEKHSGETKQPQRKIKEVSHRHIEKRRRDRINRSLWRLKDLIPSTMQKHENGKSATGSRSVRLEKAEVLELAVDYLLKIGNKSKTDNVEDAAEDGHRTCTLDATQGSDEIAESNREIYLAGFKDGVQHIADTLVSTSVLTDEDRRRLVASVDVSQHFVPKIFLTHPKKQKLAAGDDTVVSHPTRSDPSLQSTHSASQNLLASRERLGQANEDYLFSSDKRVRRIASPLSGESSSRDSTLAMESASRDNAVVTDNSYQSGWSDGGSEKSGKTDNLACSYSSGGKTCSSLSSAGSMSTHRSVPAPADSPFPSTLKAPENAASTVDTIVLPAYVLNADRTQYIPAILPKSHLLEALLLSARGISHHASTNTDPNELYGESSRTEVIENESRRNERHDFAETSGRRTKGDGGDEKHVRVITSSMTRDPAASRLRLEQHFDHLDPPPFDSSYPASQHLQGAISHGLITGDASSSLDWNSHHCKQLRLNRQAPHRASFHDEAVRTVKATAQQGRFRSSTSSDERAAIRDESYRHSGYKDLFTLGYAGPSDSMSDVPKDESGLSRSYFHQQCKQ